MILAEITIGEGASAVGSFANLALAIAAIKYLAALAKENREREDAARKAAEEREDKARKAAEEREDRALRDRQAESKEWREALYHLTTQTANLVTASEWATARMKVQAQEAIQAADKQKKEE